MLKQSIQSHEVIKTIENMLRQRLEQKMNKETIEEKNK